MTTSNDITAARAARQPSASSSTEKRSRRPRRYYLEALALPALLVGFVIFFSLWPRTAPTFPTSANIEVLIASNAVVALVAIAALIPLVCFEFDLSVGAITGLSSVYVATVLADGHGILLATLAGVVTGLVIGTVNAVLVTRLGVNAVITTLGMSTIIAGIISLQTGGVPVTGNLPEGFIAFGTQTTLGIPRLAYAVAAVAILVYYLLEHTPYGRELYAMGSSRDAAKLVGIRTKLVLGWTFVAAGALSGIAGVLLIARAGGADPRIGDNLALPAIAAAFLSAAAVKPGRYNVVGVLVAVYFLAVLNSGLNLAGAPDYVSSIVNGVALIAGVGLAVRIGRRERT